MQYHIIRFTASVLYIDGTSDKYCHYYLRSQEEDGISLMDSQRMTTDISKAGRFPSYKDDSDGANQILESWRRVFRAQFYIESCELIDVFTLDSIMLFRKEALL